MASRGAGRDGDGQPLRPLLVSGSAIGLVNGAYEPEVAQPGGFVSWVKGRGTPQEMVLEYMSRFPKIF